MTPYDMARVDRMVKLASQLLDAPMGSGACAMLIAEQIVFLQDRVADLEAKLASDNSTDSPTA